MAEKFQQAVELLREKYEKLGRLPTKNDFEDGDGQVNFIKGVLGPWPRALEKAGLKTPAPVKHRAHPHPRKTRQVVDTEKKVGETEQPGKRISTKGKRSESR